VARGLTPFSTHIQPVQFLTTSTSIGKLRTDDHFQGLRALQIVFGGAHKPPDAHFDKAHRGATAGPDGVPLDHSCTQWRIADELHPVTIAFGGYDDVTEEFCSRRLFRSATPRPDTAGASKKSDPPRVSGSHTTCPPRARRSGAIPRPVPKTGLPA